MVPNLPTFYLLGFILTDLQLQSRQSADAFSTKMFYGSKSAKAFYHQSSVLAIWYDLYVLALN